VQIRQRDDLPRRLRAGRQLRTVDRAAPDFFVTHNGAKRNIGVWFMTEMPKTLEEIDNIPHADASDKEIEVLIAKLKVFKE